MHQSVPLTILALKNDKSYYQLAPLRQGQPIDVPGFFLPGEDQDFIALNVFEDEPWRAVAHDFAYMLLNYNYPPAQGWFDEGLAEYFSSIHVDNKQVEIGGDPHPREKVGGFRQDLLGLVTAGNVGEQQFAGLGLACEPGGRGSNQMPALASQARITLEKSRLDDQRISPAHRLDQRR